MQARLGGSPEFGGAAPRDHGLENPGLDEGARGRGDAITEMRSRSFVLAVFGPGVKDGFCLWSND